MIENNKYDELGDPAHASSGSRQFQFATVPSCGSGSHISCMFEVATKCSGAPLHKETPYAKPSNFDVWPLGLV